MTQAASIAPHLPFLRRYARALTGSQSAGDAYVRAALEAVLAQKDALGDAESPRVGLYRLFHVIWSGTADKRAPDHRQERSGDPGRTAAGPVGLEP